MNLDPDNWDPLPVDELAGIFHQIPIPWWIAGGVALDLFVGRTTRPHDDIDVLARIPHITRGGIEVGQQEIQVGSQDWAIAARIAGETQWVKAETAV